ncbi:MAG: mechanosensitive ion channel family protein [Spirochaetales bacterium]|nr:mechanosensitive ion channel family protein [Spirochaetales bacterium]MBR1582846.1 mechanosensitive ion channel family protein [Spirochaetales bacterium]
MEETTTSKTVEIIEALRNWAMTTGLKIVAAILILLITFRIVTVISRRIEKKLEKSGKFDKTLIRTLSYAGRIVLKIVIATCLVGWLGVDTTGIAALIASLGVGVGLAVNGALSNFAGGILLLVTRPFKVGDYIVAQGAEGIVEDIRIISTKIVTLDNKVVHLPNGALSSGNITNYSEKEVRRVDLDFSVAGNDPELVRSLILGVCEADEKVLKEPSTFVRVTDYGAGNGVRVTMRAWCKTEQYWDTYFDLLNGVRKAFEENKIVIPFNQLDVHIKNN